MEDIIGLVANYSGLAIMAGLFVWRFIKEGGRTNELLKSLENSNTQISKAVDALKDANANIAKSLDLMSTRIEDVDKKVERNFDELRRIEGIKEK